MNSKYEVVMGLEVHVELATQTKLFCSCSAKFGADANENVCPACAGMPGMPAVTNQKAVELGIAAGIVTNSEITPVITFDKKNYFYPDLPTGYQITQLFAPVCRNGWVDIETQSGPYRIHLKQIHIEEDAGKLVHDPRTGSSLVDFNRTSVPLVEIVSLPDFRTAEQVVAYLEKLRLLLSFAGVSDCKMQEGSMRCDVNLSVRLRGESRLGVRTEMKNMNSLKAIARAIEYESERHIRALESGEETLVQETRRWDDAKGESFAMREKENATDYRYFPNPELMPIEISDDWIEKVRASLPESSYDKFARMTEQLGLSEYDSKIISGSRNLSRIFDEVTAVYPKHKDAVNWIIVDLLSIAKSDGESDEDVRVDCRKFADIMQLTDEGTINRGTGKKLLAQILREDIDPRTYVAEQGLGMVTDTSYLEDVIRETLAANEKSVNEYKAGNAKVVGFFVGQIMKKAGGKADPQTVNKLLRDFLEKMSMD